jgi:hypothetical protein
MVCYKHRNLLRAYWALLAGFVPLVVAIVYYLRVLDSQLNPPNLLVSLPVLNLPFTCNGILRMSLCLS